MKLFKNRYNYKLPTWLKWMGCERICDDSIEFKWGYLSFGSGPKFYLDHTYEYGIPCINICLFFIGIHVELPFIKQRYEDVNNSPKYGMNYHSRGFWWDWGLKYWVFFMPWDWERVSHKVWSKDGWISPIEDYDRDFGKPYKDGRTLKIYKYEYLLKSGEKQVRDAEVYREKREWRWRYFECLPFPRKIEECIDVYFSDEVGERTGSWKGGVLGTGYVMKKNESMTQCLRRMEKEQKF